MLVKETVAARRNTSPTNHFEISQLYAAGALKVSCVGLQCVGFNMELYQTIMDQAAKCRASGVWKSQWGGPDVPIAKNNEVADTWLSGHAGPVYAPQLSSL